MQGSRRHQRNRTSLFGLPPQGHPQENVKHCAKRKRIPRESAAQHEVEGNAPTPAPVSNMQERQTRSGPEGEQAAHSS